MPEKLVSYPDSWKEAATWSIALRLPMNLLERIKTVADARDMPYQSHLLHNTATLCGLESIYPRTYRYEQ